MYDWDKYKNQKHMLLIGYTTWTYIQEVSLLDAVAKQFKCTYSSQKTKPDITNSDSLMAPFFS